MSQHLGEEFIAVRPDARGFRAELQAQVSGALSGVQSHVSAAQRSIGKATSITPAGIVLPAGVRSVKKATEELGTATKATSEQLKKLQTVNVQSQSSSHSLSRSFREAERDAGRYTRGMFAATAASTGFFRAVTFASGAFLIGAAAGATIGAAIKEFSDAVRVQAQTNALIKATGGAANVTAQQVDALGLSVLNLTGIDDELVKSSANIILCLEESAEALTRDRGWVPHDDLAVGDEILAYDPEDDTTRWEPVLDIYRYHHVTELVRWKSKQIDVATTPHHRWWSTGRTTVGSEKLATMQDYRFRTTEEITGHQFAVKIGGGSPGCFRDDPVYSDDLVELAAWVFTEGAFPKAVDQTGRSAERRRRLGIPEERPCSRCDDGLTPRRRGPAVCDDCRTSKSALQTARRQIASPRDRKTERVSRHYHVTFSQSETANPANVDRIRALLERLRDDGHVIGEHSYLAAYNGSKLIRWDFARDLGQALRMLLPQKKLTPTFLNSLTAKQARMFFDVLILGDGSVNKKGYVQFIQKDPEQLDLVAMLAGMLGIRTSRLGRGDSLYFCKSNHLWGHTVNATVEQYDGVVWCPQIRTQIFLARNRGRTFWTGNTFRAIRNEVGQGNNIFDRAVKSVADISSVFKTDLRSSAVQVGKALQDPVRGVTALRRSGISLSVGQRDLIKRLVQTGNVLAAQKVILGEVDRQVGKTAESIGKTLPGRLAILRERSKNALGEYVRRVTESKEATELATSAGAALSEVFNVLKGIVAALGPSFLLFARGTFAVTKAIGGGGTILAAVVAYKAIKIAIESAAVAQAFFTKQTLLGMKAITAEEAALLSSAGAFRGRSAAELLGTSARVKGREIPIGKAASETAASAIVLPAGVRSVGKETAEIGAVSGLAAARLGLFQTALTALKGPLGVGIAIAGVTAVLIKLSQTAEGMPGSLKAVTGALRPLSDAIREAQQAQTAIAGRREDVSIARFNQAAAVRGVQQAQDALNRSHAAEGSPLRVHLINQERAANQRLRDSVEELAKAQGVLDDELARQDRDRKARATATANAQRAVAEQIQFALRPPALGRGALAGAAQSDAQRAAKGFGNLLRLTDDLSASGDRLNKTVGGALRAILTTLDKIPTDKQIRLVVKLAAQGASTDAILRALGVLSPGTAAETEGRRLAPPPGIAGQEALFQTLKAQEALERKRFQTLRDIAAQRRGELATQREQVAASRDARDAAREALQSSIRGLTDARRTLADSQRTLTDTIRDAHQAVADAIRQGRESVNQSVRDAKSNLDDLGQAVADALGKFSEAGSGATKGLGARLRALRAEILRSGGGFQTERAAQEIAFRVQQQPKANVDTEKIKQNFADLTDAVNRGTISLPQFKKRLQDLLKGFSLTDFRKQTGSAAANLLREQIGTLKTQAGINLTGPRRPGGGTQTDLVKPLVAVAEASKAIASARVQAAREIAGAKRDLGDAIRGVSDAEKQITKSQRDLRNAERELIRAQAKETRLNTAATKANTRAHTQLVAFLQAQQRLSPTVKPPQGEKGKTTTGLVAHGARNP